jgi:hypothetical protein
MCGVRLLSMIQATNSGVGIGREVTLSKVVGVNTQSMYVNSTYQYTTRKMGFPLEA